MSKQESVLSYLLTKAGKTFKDLANYIGVEESTPYRWSRGTRVPSGRVWRELESFLEEECGYRLSYLDQWHDDLNDFRGYLSTSIDSEFGADVVEAVEEFYKPKNTLEQYLAKFRDENGNEVELPKGSITVSKHPVHEHLEDIVGQPINWNAKAIPEYEVDHTVEDSSRDGISLHGGGSGCITLKAVKQESIKDMIEDKFKRFIGNQHLVKDDFIRLVEVYTKYHSVVNVGW